MTSTAVALALVAACGTQGPPKGAFTRIEVANVLATPSHELDLLLLIDDSNAGVEHATAFGKGLPALLAALDHVDGGRPSLHVGVATSDMGTTGSLDYAHPAPGIGQVGNGGCAGHGRDGELHVDAAVVTGKFIVDEPGTMNYQGTLADAIAKLAVGVGGGGCGFEQHFAGIARALGNPLNAGFRRTGANLGIVIVADEDDCSVRDPAFFGTAAELGPLQSYRCTQFGLQCDQDITVPGYKTNCAPLDGSQYVEDLGPIRDALAAAAPDPAQLAVAAVVGDPTPVQIELRAPPGGGTQIDALAHSCAYQEDSGPAVADPGVRIAALATAQASRGSVSTICGTSLTAGAAIGRVLARMHGVLCLEGPIADPPTCTATDVAPGGDEAELPGCPADGDCLELATDATTCDTPDHLRAVIHRVTPPPAGTHVVVRCVST